MVDSSKIVLTGLAVVLIIVLVFFPTYSCTQAQTNTTFTPQDKFSITELNGSISFSVNGSCSAATLENGTWIFKDLKLNSSRTLGTLKISAENSNVTVDFYGKIFQFGRSAMLNYTVEGQGKQTVNLGLNSSQPTSTAEWFVIGPDNSFLSQGNGWDLLPDNTVVVTNVTGNVFIVYFSFNLPVSDSNLPFYLQHSIAIITAIVVAVIVALAVVIKVKGRK